MDMELLIVPPYPFDICWVCDDIPTLFTVIAICVVSIFLCQCCYMFCYFIDLFKEPALSFTDFLYCFFLFSISLISTLTFILFFFKETTLLRYNLGSIFKLYSSMTFFRSLFLNVQQVPRQHFILDMGSNRCYGEEARCLNRSGIEVTSMTFIKLT